MMPSGVSGSPPRATVALTRAGGAVAEDSTRLGLALELALAAAVDGPVTAGDGTRLADAVRDPVRVTDSALLGDLLGVAVRDAGTAPVCVCVRVPLVGLVCDTLPDWDAVPLSVPADDGETLADALVLGVRDCDPVAVTDGGPDDDGDAEGVAS